MNLRRTLLRDEEGTSAGAVLLAPPRPPEAGGMDALARVLGAGLILTDPHAEQLLWQNADAAALWGADAPGPLPGLAGRMAALAADPGVVRAVWSTAWAEWEGTSQGTALRLCDGREYRWRSFRIGAAETGMPMELHLFEPVSLPSAGAAAGPGASLVDNLFRQTFDKAAVGMAVVSPEFRLLQTNAAFDRLLGSEVSVAGLQVDAPTASWWDWIWPEDAASLRGQLYGLLGNGEPVHADQRFRDRQGLPVWVHLSVSLVHDGRGKPDYLIAMAEDISAQKLREAEQEQRAQELQSLARTDPLTGLDNVRSMEEGLSRRVSEARRYGTFVCALMLDLDHFRRVNASFGHDAGDRALRAVAECLRRSLREGDLACRYGGEEFIVILSGTAAEGQAAAERIRRRVADLPPVAAGAGTITCSIGVAGFPDHASTADSLLKAADEALLSAKHAGRDRVCLFQPGPWELGPDQIERLGSGLQGAGQDAIRALITAIDLRDRFTAAHCQRVGRLAVSLGETLGCSLDELEVLRAGAPLIDVGKIGLPDYLLAKAGRLTRPEWELMRQHPIWGEQLVKCSSLPRDALQVVRWHHERLDGSGYPDGLTAARLPLVVRIAAVADVATALREDRPHREAWPRARVLQYLRRTAGKRFDADVVEAFCRL